MNATDPRGAPGATAPARRTAADAERLLPAAGETEAAGFGDLLRDLATDTRTLIRQELELARVEVRQTVGGVARDSAWIGAGAAILAVGGIVLVVGLALGLGALLGSYWLGTLITAVVLLAVGGLVAWKGLRTLRRRTFLPARTIETLRADADWARREAEEFGDGLKD